MTEKATVPEALERLAVLVSDAQDAFILKRLDGTVVAWNPAAERLYGYSAEEMVGRSLARLLPPDRPNELPALMDRVRRGEPVDHYETERICKDGSRIHVSVSISPVRDETGKIIGAVSIKRDISARVREEEERAQLLAEAQAGREAAEAALRERDQFLSMPAHELKTPTTSLRLYAQVLLRIIGRRGQVDSDQLRRSLTVIDGQSERLARLVNQLLDVSRIELGEFHPSYERLDVVPLVKRVAETAELTTERHTLTVQAPARLEAWLDPLRVEQVLTNLLDNAIKYSPDGGPVTVRLADPQDGVLEVRVQDRGLGVPPQHRARLFDRFFRAHDEHSIAGLGIGLYVSRQIVEAHGGTIHAEFPEEGGTCFVVHLPINGPPVRQVEVAADA